MKKLLSLILSVLLAFSCVTAYAASGVDGAYAGGVAGASSSVKANHAATVSYGADNLNNTSGDLVIGFLGGSITEGSGASSIQNRWSTRVVDEYFKKKYPKKNVIERNASIGGTTSEYGMIRMRKDLSLNSSSTPDVVFVEFAVNDAYSKGMVLTERMEGIVRQLLSLPKIPVIVFVYTTSVDSYYNTGTRDGKCVENAIDAFHVVAENYGIYEVNLNDYVWQGVRDGKFTWVGGMSADGVHPNDYGYEVYAKRIIELFEKDGASVFKKLDKNTKPCSKNVYGCFEEIPLDDSSVKLNGAWEKKTYDTLKMDGMVGGRYYERFFKNGYMHAADGEKVSAEIEFYGCGIGCDFVRTKNNAYVKWEVFDANGSMVKSGTSRDTYYKGDTGRCCGSVYVSALPYGKYTLKITGVKNETAEKDYQTNPSTGGSGIELNIGYFAVEQPDEWDVPVGEVSLKAPVELTVNDKLAENTGVGKNKFKGTLANPGEKIINVTSCAAVYKTVGGYKYLEDLGFATKVLKPSAEGEFSVEATADDSSREVKFFAFASGFLEPVKIK